MIEVHWGRSRGSKQPGYLLLLSLISKGNEQDWKRGRVDAEEQKNGTQCRDVMNAQRKKSPVIERTCSSGRALNTVGSQPPPPVLSTRLICSEKYNQQHLCCLEQSSKPGTS